MRITATRRIKPRASPAPDIFEVARGARRGSHPLLELFPHLDRLPAFQELPGTPAERRDVAKKTLVQVVPGRVWMYVAPHELPELLRRLGVGMFLSPRDCIVVGTSHLRRSARIILYMDILHELTHVFQRRHGRDLWMEGYRYADRPTEIEAYIFAVKLAREQGASDAFLREYLNVEWIDRKEYRLLLKNLGVKAG